MTRLFNRSKKVMIYLYDTCKYTATAEELENCTVIEYDYCTGFEAVEGDAAKEIENHTDGGCIDENGEYLVLFFEDNKTATFRNSHADLFVIGNSR